MTPAAVIAGAARWALVGGDCLDVLPTIERVDHVITDPPYTQRTSDKARRSSPGSSGVLRDANAFISFAGVDGLETRLSEEFLRVASRWVVVFCALEQLGTYAAACGPSWIRGSAWLRTNSAPQFTGDRPGQAHEGIAIAHRKGRKRWARGGHTWAPVGPTVNAMRDPQHGALAHPTPKPEWLMLDAIEAFTDPDDIILDPFAGSGTTGVACLRLGRRFIGIEKDPKYAALARERLEAEAAGSTLQAARAGQTAMFGGGR